MGDTGPELPQYCGGKPRVNAEGGAKCGALLGESAPSGTALDPELARLVAAWIDLSPAIRAGIMAMVDACQGGAR